jgi:hypothetical protein
VHEADAAFQYWPGVRQSQAQRRWALVREASQVEEVEDW